MTWKKSGVTSANICRRTSDQHVPKWFAVAPERGQEPPETEGARIDLAADLASTRITRASISANSALSDSMRAVFAMGSTRR